MRLDIYLVQKGVARSRERAKERIAHGDVQVGDKTILKPSYNVVFGDDVQVTGDGLKWVSRGALKLEHALDEWDVSAHGQTCLDIGASTGGFTEVLLDRGACKVYAVDVGHGQLHENLRDDERVVNMEGLHIKDLTKEMLHETVNIVVIDVSFISLEHVLPKVYDMLEDGGVFIALVKPQFEVGKDNTKKGVVTDGKAREKVIEHISTFAQDIGFIVAGTIESPIVGGDGNVEFLLCAHKKV